MGKLPPSVTVSTGASPQGPRRPKSQEAISVAGGAKAAEAATKAEPKSNPPKAEGPKPAQAEKTARPDLRVSSETTQTGMTRRPADDDFEPSQAFGKPIQATELPVIPPSVPGNKPRSGVLELLDEAEEPGVFFKEREHGDGERDDEENDELQEAVEEAIRLLFGVRGIHSIGPGEDVEGNPVVLISANQGFSTASFERVPPYVNGFKTLLALPYELLPLRRERT